jgi:hypothetical protein
MKDNIAAVLEARFSQIPADLVTRIHQISELDALRRLLRHAATVESLADFAETLDEEWSRLADNADHTLPQNGTAHPTDLSAHP